jgi:hypothetical protein
MVGPVTGFDIKLPTVILRIRFEMIHDRERSVRNDWSTAGKLFHRPSTRVIHTGLNPMMDADRDN